MMSFSSGMRSVISPAFGASASAARARQAFQLGVGLAEQHARAPGSGTPAPAWNTEYRACTGRTCPDAKQPARRHQYAMQLVHHRGLADARNSRTPAPVPRAAPNHPREGVYQGAGFRSPP